MSTVIAEPRDQPGAAASAPLVKAEHLTCVFDVSRPWLERTLAGAPKQSLTAVADLSFEIARRETFALVGEFGFRQVDGGAHGGRAAAADRGTRSASTASRCPTRA